MLYLGYWEWVAPVSTFSRVVAMSFPPSSVEAGAFYLEYLLKYSYTDKALPCLNKAQEKNIFLRYRAATGIDKQKLEEEIVLRNLKLASYHTAKFKGIMIRDESFDLDDLLDEAIVVLIKCIRKFDPERGWKFSTLASLSICRHFVKIANKNRLGAGVNIPTNVGREVFQENTEVTSVAHGHTSNHDTISDESIESDVFMRQALGKLNREDQNLLQLLMSGLTMTDYSNATGLTRHEIRGYLQQLAMNPNLQEMVRS